MDIDHCNIVSFYALQIKGTWLSARIPKPKVVQQCTACISIPSERHQPHGEMSRDKMTSFTSLHRSCTRQSADTVMLRLQVQSQHISGTFQVATVWVESFHPHTHTCTACTWRATHSMISTLSSKGLQMPSYLWMLPRKMQLNTWGMMLQVE